MKLNAGGKRSLEPFYVLAVKSRLAWLEIDFNEQPLNSDHFEAICEAEEIVIIRTLQKWTGAYFKRKGRDVIHVNAGLVGTMKSFVEFHELAHYWLHEPGFYLTRGQGLFRSKCEYQASFISACALIPCTYLASFSANELYEMYTLRDLVDFRLKIFRAYMV